MKVFVGVDCGGTWTRVGKINENKEVITEVKFESLKEKSADEAIRILENKIKEVVVQDELQGIGVALCGVVNKDVLVACTNLPSLVNYPVKESLSDIFKVPVYLENDANAAALAEAVEGSGKGYESVYYMTFSTGAGGAYVLNQQVVAGAHGCAGEISFLPLKDDYQGNDFTGKAVARRGNRSTKEVFDNYDTDAECKAIVDDVIEKIGAVLSCVSLIVDPDVIVLAGGMMSSLCNYWKEIESSYECKIFEGLKADLKLASFKEAGLLGAALIPMTKRW